MAVYTVRRGQRYRATIALGVLQRLASNETIANKLREAGFSETRVWGGGGKRFAEALWLGEDATAEVPSEIKSVTAIT